MAAQLPVKHAAMAIGPIDHRRDAENMLLVFQMLMAHFKGRIW